MNINHYKEAASHITVDSESVLKRFEKDNLTKYYIQNRFERFFGSKQLRVAIVSSLLVIALLMPFLNPINRQLDFTITVYAAETSESQVLSATPLSIATNYNWNDMGSTNSSYGTVNFDLNFICEGDNIDSITYKISDQEINRGNKRAATAWFGENCTYPSGYDSRTDPSVYEAMFNPSTKEWSVKKMIGSSYTVAYMDQTNRNYALEINFVIDDDNNYITEDFQITVLITMTDQTIVEKVINVTSVVSAPYLVESQEDLPRIELVLD